MKTTWATRGCTIVEPLVGATIGLAVLAGVTVALAEGARWVRRAGVRTETFDTATLVAEAFTFDLRSAGWDPLGTSGARLVAAGSDGLELHADRDEDGTIDLTSAERVRWELPPGTRAIRRILGAQSMPLASIATSAVLEYRDAAATIIPTPPTGLDPASLSRVRSVALRFTLTAPGGVSVSRNVTVALRGVEP